MTAEPLTQDAVRALIEEADPHVVDPSSGWVCCDWCGETRDQECESCEKAWPCVTRRLADTLAAPIAEATPTHCPSCDGYQTAVMDAGQRSVGVCEGVAARTVETAEEWGVKLPDGYVAHPFHSLEDAEWMVSRKGGEIQVRRVVAPTQWEPVTFTPEKQMLMTHPHDGHGLNDTCVAYSTLNPEKPDLSPVRTRPADASNSGPQSNTSEEPATDRECGNDSHHGYGTGYCGDCTKEAADGN